MDNPNFRLFVCSKVLNFILAEGEKYDEGISVFKIVHFIGCKKYANIAIDLLEAEGYIYSTINEYYYKFAS